MRRLHIYVLILLFILLIVSIQTQRGRSRSSSRSSFGRSKSTSYGKKVNKLDANNTRQLNEEQKKIVQIVQYFLTGVGSIMACVVAYAIYFIIKGSLNGSFKEKTVQQRMQIIKQKKNNVDYHIMTLPEYSQKRDKFIQMINLSAGKNSKYCFTFQQNNKQSKISNVKVKLIITDQFIDTIQLQGIDQIGSWTAKGYIMAQLNQQNQSFIYVWWKKDYKNKYAARQTQNGPFLLYETYNVKQDQIKGRWYFEAKKKKYTYGKSGKWFIKNNNINKQHEA